MTKDLSPLLVLVVASYIVRLQKFVGMPPANCSSYGFLVVMQHTSVRRTRRALLNEVQYTTWRSEMYESYKARSIRGDWRRTHKLL